METSFRPNASSSSGAPSDADLDAEWNAAHPSPPSGGAFDPDAALAAVRRNATASVPPAFDPDKALAEVPGQGTAPGAAPGTDTSGFDPDRALADVRRAAVPDADLWERFTANGVDPNSATALVKARGSMHPADVWESLNRQGVRADSATALTSAATGINPDQALDAGWDAAHRSPSIDAGTNDSAAEAAGSHAISGALYGFDKDIGPALMYGVQRIPGAYKLFKDPTTGQPRTAPASYADLKSEYGQDLANEQTAHPLASTAGEVAGLVASPVNRLVNAAATVGAARAAALPIVGRLATAAAPVVRGALGGAAAGGLYGFGNSTGPLLTREQAAMKGAETAAPIGAVLGPLAEAAGNAFSRGSLRGGLDAGQLAQTMDADIATAKAQAAPLWNRVRAIGDAPVSGPATDDLLNSPEAPRAWQMAREYALNSGDNLPPFPQPGTPVANDAVAAAMRSDNPGWSETRIQQALQDPDLVRAYTSGALGKGLAATGIQAPTAASDATRVSGGIPLRGLQAMKESLNDFIRRGQDSPNGFTVRNAQALQKTLYRAIGEARTQYPAYGDALDASAGYKSVEPVRDELEKMLQPNQAMAAGVASGDITPEQAQTFAQSARGPGRGVAAKGAGAVGLTMAGHPFMGIGLASTAVRDLAKSVAGGALSAEQIAKLVQVARDEGSTGRLAQLMGRAAAQSPSRVAGLLPNAARAAAAKSGGSLARSTSPVLLNLQRQAAQGAP